MSEWFSVRCVFKNGDAYEERITLWRAIDFDDAIARAEDDAREHAEILAIEYIGLAQTFRLPDSDLQSGVEIFSLIRQSDLEPNAYLDAFFDTGGEIQQTSD